ncbi:Hsp20/alpha crystallin family protein [bacterium]|jgi:HSP20 family protein|nr:Hsp20/alpha crystallin family protein [bacterium]
MNYIINNKSRQRTNNMCTEAINAFIHPTETNDIYTDFFQTLFNPETVETKQWVARLNLKETKDSVTVITEIPGIKKNNIEIEYHDGILKISGNKKDHVSTENDNYIHREISFGNFSRNVQVGDIDFENSTANISDGVLTIHLPKSEEKKAKTLKIT